MKDFPEPISRLIAELKRLPGIGLKSAQRVAFHLLRSSAQESQALSQAIRDVKEKITTCQICNNVTDVNPCVFCTRPDRTSAQLCVVEEPPNVVAIEKAHEFKGRYHVLMGALSPLQGIGPRAAQDRGTAGATQVRGDRGGHPRHQSQRRGRSHRYLPRQAHQAPKNPRDPHRHGNPRRQRARLRRRGDHHESSGGTPRFLTSAFFSWA